MGVKKVSQNGKGSYAAYKASLKFNKNKKRKIERHLKLQPNDTQAQDAMKNVANLKPRKEPVRKKARLDSWVCKNEKGELSHNRSQNLLSGRLSPWGKFTQWAAAFSKANQNRLLNDPKKVLYLHNVPALSLNEVWDGWAAFEANGHRPVNQEKRKPSSKNKPRKK